MIEILVKNLARNYSKRKDEKEGAVWVIFKDLIVFTFCSDLLFQAGKARNNQTCNSCMYNFN